jgi:hypothetical protein
MDEYTDDEYGEYYIKLIFKKNNFKMTSNLPLPVNLRGGIREETRDTKKFEKRLVEILQDILYAQITYISAPSTFSNTNRRSIDIDIKGIYDYSINLKITNTDVDKIRISYTKDIITLNNMTSYTVIRLIMNRLLSTIKVNKFKFTYTKNNDTEEKEKRKYKYHSSSEIDYLKLQLFIRFRNVLREKKILH